MHAQNRPPKPNGVRTSVIFHTVWVTTAALVLFDVSSERSTLRSFIAPLSAPETVVDRVETAKVFGGTPGNAAVEPSRSAHTYFNFAGESDRTVENSPEPAPMINLVGQWTGAVEAGAVGSLWTSGACDYEIRSLDFQLRNSGEDVYGYGAYTLLAEKCPEAELVTRYASTTGKVTAQYLKLNIRNNGSANTDLVYYGTMKPEGIVGHIRTGYGELLTEHVTLVRR